MAKLLGAKIKYLLPAFLPFMLRAPGWALMWLLCRCDVCPTITTVPFSNEETKDLSGRALFLPSRWPTVAL